MAITKTLLSTQRYIPETGEYDWGAGASGMTKWCEDITDLAEGVLTATRTKTKRVQSPFQAVTATTGSTAIDFSAGHNVRLTLQLSTTLTFNNGADGERYYLHVKQDATGGRTITWPASVRWRGGSAPTLTATANARDVVCFMYDATDAIFLGEYGTNFA